MKELGCWTGQDCMALLLPVLTTWMAEGKLSHLFSQTVYSSISQSMLSRTPLIGSVILSLKMFFKNASVLVFHSVKESYRASWHSCSKGTYFIQYCPPTWKILTMQPLFQEHLKELVLGTSLGKAVLGVAAVLSQGQFCGHMELGI